MRLEYILIKAELRITRLCEKVQNQYRFELYDDARARKAQLTG